MPRPVRITGIKGRRAIPSLVRTSGIAPESFLTTRLPKFSMTLEGVDRVKRIFKQISKNTQSSMYNAISAATAIVAFEAQRITRVGPYKAYKTGKLSNSIKGMVEKFALDMVEGVAGVFNVDYAIYVHEGTSNMIPKPFLLLALKRKRKIVIKLLRKALEKDIKTGWF